MDTSEQIEQKRLNLIKQIKRANLTQLLSIVIVISSFIFTYTPKNIINSMNNTYEITDSFGWICTGLVLVLGFLFMYSLQKKIDIKDKLNELNPASTSIHAKLAVYKDTATVKEAIFTVNKMGRKLTMKEAVDLLSKVESNEEMTVNKEKCKKLYGVLVHD